MVSISGYSYCLKIKYSIIIGCFSSHFHLSLYNFHRNALNGKPLDLQCSIMYSKCVNYNRFNLILVMPSGKKNETCKITEVFTQNVQIARKHFIVDVSNSKLFQVQYCISIKIANHIHMF